MRATRILTTLVIALAVAACGPAEETDAPVSDPPADEPAAVEQPVDEPAADEPAMDDPIRIGASISLSGKYERTGAELNHGYDLCAEAVNAAGGVLGRPVEFVIYDDQSDPETGAKLYEKLITEDEVDLIIGPYSSPVTIPASAVTERLGYPMIASGASSSEIWGREFKYVVGVYTMAPFYLHGAIYVAKQEGLSKVAILTEDGAFALDAVGGARELAEAEGMEVVHYEEYGRDVTDLSAAISKAKAAGAEVLLGGTYGPDSELIIRQSKELGFAPRMFAFTVGPALPDFAENLGEDAELVFGATQWEPAVKAPGVDAFTATYESEYGYSPGYHAAGGYGACQLLQEAVEQAGALDQDAIRDALYAIQTTTVFGAYEVDETGAQSAKHMYLVQWQGGERVIVWPFDAAQADYQLP